MMRDIRYFGDYQGEDGYVIVDSLEGEIPGGKKKLSEFVNGLKYVEIAGTVEDTTMTVTVENNVYAVFEVPAEVETLVIKLNNIEPGKFVANTMFQFTLPEEASLENVSVIDKDNNDKLVVSPMSWPGLVTYQGNVVNGIATIFGYSPDI